MDDQRYTLDEAQRILAERQCADHGHDWTVVDVRTYADPAGTPTSVVCNRCHQSHPVLTDSPAGRCPDHGGPRCDLHCPQHG